MMVIEIQVMVVVPYVSKKAINLVALLLALLLAPPLVRLLRRRKADPLIPDARPEQGA